MAGVVTGRVEVLVNGELVLNRPGAIARGIGESGKPAMERKPVMGANGINGFVEEAVPAECEIPITDRSDIKLDDYAQIFENGTIVFRAARGGKVYTMQGATCTNNMELTGGEGEIDLKFVGPFWTETT